MKRYYIVYEGIVQGVGFRWTMMNLARSLGLTGYVRNLYNGNVEVEVQGEQVDAFLKGSLVNDGFIQIYDYAIKEKELIEDEKEFTVRF